MADRVLRGNETVLFIPAYIDEAGEVFGLYPGGIVNINDFDSSILNHWIPANTAKHASANGGGNVSCSIKDDMALGLTDSDTDSDRTLCDVGQNETPTTKNYEGTVTVYRDLDPAANGAYNLGHKLTFAPDVPYIVAHRIGRKQTELSVATDLWDLYSFATDVQVPNYGDKANVTVTSTLIPKSVENFAHELPA